MVFPKTNPLKRFDEAKFQARYRLDKTFVQQISLQFDASVYCRTQGGSPNFILGTFESTSSFFLIL